MSRDPYFDVEAIVKFFNAQIIFFKKSIIVFSYLRACKQGEPAFDKYTQNFQRSRSNSVSSGCPFEIRMLSSRIVT